MNKINGFNKRTQLTQMTTERAVSMKEFRFTQNDLLELPTNPILCEFYLRNKLKNAGFDLDKEIKFHNDVVKNEYVYTQED